MAARFNLLLLFGQRLVLRFQRGILLFQFLFILLGLRLGFV